MADKHDYRPHYYVQPELPHLPPPMTRNRALDHQQGCQFCHSPRCRRECGDPLGR